MSHVDEGLLHAYLDGAFPKGNAQGDDIEAHLAVCVDCRVRLEDARTLKERTQVVLHHASPAEVRVPPFDTVLARRPESQSAAARKRASWLPPVKLAWAATMILAVGAGWMANEVLRGGSASRSAGQVERSAAAPAASAESDMAAPPATVRDAQTVAGQAAESEQAVAGLAADRDGTSARDADTGVQQPPPAPVNVPAPLVMVQPFESAQVQAKRTSDSLDRAAVAADEIRVSPTTTESRARRELMAVTSRVAEQQRPAAPLALESIVAAGAARTTLVRDADEVLNVEQLFGAAADSAARQDMVRLLNDYVAVESADSWQESTPVEARAALGRELATLSGAQPAALEQAGIEERTLVRTRYVLQSGDTVELVQSAPTPTAVFEEDILLRDAIAPSMTAIPLSGLEERSQIFRGESVLWLPSSSLTLLLKSKAPLDSLQALTTRIR